MVRFTMQVPRPDRSAWFTYDQDVPCGCGAACWRVPTTRVRTKEGFTQPRYACVNHVPPDARKYLQANQTKSKSWDEHRRHFENRAKTIGRDDAVCFAPFCMTQADFSVQDSKGRSWFMCRAHAGPPRSEMLGKCDSVGCEELATVKVYDSKWCQKHGKWSQE